jgi:transcriptional regulator with XRE-family HTH domain
MDSSRPRHGVIYTSAYRHITDRLRTARRLAGYTQVRAAKALGRPISFISKCELGDRKVDPVDLMEFAMLYGQPVLYFLPPEELVREGMRVRKERREDDVLNDRSE